ncbi:MAG TPA: hypothetical protein VJ183_15420 [Chloroflexia bacterium]|nr:hypothetical protein [Chloroflexia bacterium]
MTESDIAATGAATTASPQNIPAGTNANDYPISPEGRRQAIVLLLGVATLWLFAVWSLITLFDGGLSGIEWVSAVLMLGIVLVAPVVGWALLEEANSRITTSESGIRYCSLMGIDLLYKWEELSDFQATGRKGKIARFFLGDDKDESAHDTADAAPSEDDTEPDTRLLNTPDRINQIQNPLARILHKLSHGASLPLYGGIECRNDLLNEITSHLPQPHNS